MSWAIVTSSQDEIATIFEFIIYASKKTWFNFCSEAPSRKYIAIYLQIFFNFVNITKKNDLFTIFRPFLSPVKLRKNSKMLLNLEIRLRFNIKGKKKISRFHREQIFFRTQTRQVLSYSRNILHPFTENQYFLRRLMPEIEASYYYIRLRLTIQH